MPAVAYTPKTIHGKHREYISFFFTPSYSNPNVMKNLQNYFKDSQIWSELRRDAKEAAANDEFNDWFSKKDGKDTAYEVLAEWNNKIAGVKYPKYKPSATDMNQFAKLIYYTFTNYGIINLEKIKIQEAKENGTYKPAKKAVKHVVKKTTKAVKKTTKRGCGKRK